MESYEVIDIIFRIIITMFSYMIVPVILTAIGIKFRKKAIIIIVILNGVIVFSLWSLLHFLDGTNARPDPAMIWSLINYGILKKLAFKSENPDANILPNTTNQTPRISMNKYYDLENDNEESSNVAKKVFIGLLAIAFVILILIFVLLYKNGFDNFISKDQHENFTEVEKTVYIRDRGSYYHADQDCYYLRINSNIKRHHVSVEEAEEKGYIPCPDCYKAGQLHVSNAQVF